MGLVSHPCVAALHVHIGPVHCLVFKVVFFQLLSWTQVDSQGVDYGSNHGSAATWYAYDWQRVVFARVHSVAVEDHGGCQLADALEVVG